MAYENWGVNLQYKYRISQNTFFVSPQDLEKRNTQIRSTVQDLASREDRVCKLFVIQGDVQLAATYHLSFRPER